MADIKLDFAWSIEADGELEISVSPSKAPSVILGKFTMDEDLFLDALQDDIQDFENGASDIIFLEWEFLADFLMDIALKVNSRVDVAKAVRNNFGKVAA
jgi:hypothetical protein